MKEQKTTSKHVSRRGFMKLITFAIGTGLGSPLLISCAPKDKQQFEVDIVVEQSEIHYSPATLTVPSGSTVTWLNKSYYSQSATCDPDQDKEGVIASLPQNAQTWNSGVLYPGQRFTKTFDTPGTYVYFSLPRLSPNTVGTIIVQ